MLSILSLRPNLILELGNRRSQIFQVNSGNHCFVNAVVQALAACPCLQGWLENSTLSSFSSMNISRLAKVFNMVLFSSSKKKYS